MNNLPLISFGLGIIYAAYGLGLIVDRKQAQSLITDLLDSPPVLLISGFVAVFFGIFTFAASFSNSCLWSPLFQFVAGLAIFKGIILIAFPYSMRIGKSITEIKSVMAILPVVLLLLSALFFYLASVCV